MATKKKMYVLKRDKRFEQGEVRKAGWATDLAHYSDEMVDRLLSEGIYAEIVDGPVTVEKSEG